MDKPAWCRPHRPGVSQGESQRYRFALSSGATHLFFFGRKNTLIYAYKTSGWVLIYITRSMSSFGHERNARIVVKVPSRAASRGSAAEDLLARFVESLINAYYDDNKAHGGDLYELKGSKKNIISMIRIVDGQEKMIGRLVRVDGGQQLTPLGSTYIKPSFDLVLTDTIEGVARAAVIDKLIGFLLEDPTHNYLSIVKNDLILMRVFAATTDNVEEFMGAFPHDSSDHRYRVSVFEWNRVYETDVKKTIDRMK